LQDYSRSRMGYCIYTELRNHRYLSTTNLLLSLILQPSYDAAACPFYGSQLNYPGLFRLTDA